MINRTKQVLSLVTPPLVTPPLVTPPLVTPPLVILPLVTLLGIACDGDKSSVDSAAACEAPMAEAGDNISVVLGDTVQLDAGDSEVCEDREDDAEFTWTFEAVEPGSAIDESALSSNNDDDAVNAVFVPDVPGTYTLSVTVFDAVATSDPDFVVVTVTSNNLAPLADCGADLSGVVGDRVNLDGSGSSDPDGGTLEYSWGLSDGPDCSGLGSTDLFNADSVSPTFVPDCEGVYTVSLVVSDGEEWSDPAVCIVSVVDGNQAPTADAGQGGDLGACAENPLELSGWGSYDIDEDSLTYQWSVVAVPPKSAAGDAQFDDATSAAPTFTWDVEGTYTFQLQVSDGEIWSAPDVVSYTIQEIGENETPVANAGDAQTVDVEADCESSSYVWSCGDCPSATIELDGSASYDLDGDHLTYGWTESTGTATFSASRSAVTEATIPSQSASYDTPANATFEFALEVADCDRSATDRVNVTYTCTGESN